MERAAERGAAGNGHAGPGRWPWGQRMLARIDEVEAAAESTPEQQGGARHALECLEHARTALARRGLWRSSSVAAAQAHLHAAQRAVLQVLPLASLQGRLPEIRALVEEHLPARDPRRLAVQALCQRKDRDAFAERDRETLVCAVQAAYVEEEREFDAVRKCRFTLYAAALITFLLAGGLAALMALEPDLAPLCFEQSVGGAEREVLAVCPSRTLRVPAELPSVERAFAQGAATRLDYVLVELFGVLGATLSAGATLPRLRLVRGPYNLVLPLGLLKVPTGALTAVAGILLIRGGFVPGLSALDSPPQIVAWALVFGSAQQLFTHVMDRYSAALTHEVHGTSNPRAPRPLREGEAAA